MLKWTFLTFLVIILSSCGVDWNREKDCFNGCHQPGSKRTDESSVVYIGVPGPAGQNGSNGVAGKNGIDGLDGLAGQDGVNGQNGHSTVFLVGPASLDVCPAGGSTFLVALDSNDSGALEVEEDQNLQSATICNGATGANGEDGKDGADGLDAPPTQFTPVAVIDPCGDAPGIVDEVLLKLADGTILASFSENANGKNTRFALIGPGNYVTTDGSVCKFTINASGDIVNEHY